MFANAAVISFRYVANLNLLRPMGFIFSAYSIGINNGGECAPLAKGDTAIWNSFL